VDELLDRTRRDRPVSWPGVLAGVLPFLLLGTGMVLLAYPYPPPAWRSASPAFAPVPLLYMPLPYIIVLMLGLIVGWIKHWPAWAYAYLGPVLLLPALAAANAISAAMFKIGGFAIWLEGPIFLGVMGLVAILTRLITRRSDSGRALVGGIRHDWTRLSFSLFVLAAFILGGHDYDEDPVLTLYVILPTLFIVAAAIVYLRGQTQATRGIALMVGLGLAVVTRMVGGAYYYIIYGVLLAAMIFWPGLIRLGGQAGRDATHPT
jgi:hypothetical protein